MKNLTRFWTGVVMGALEVIAIAIFGLSKLEMSKVILILIISGVVLYNGIAGILIWFGSKGDK